MINDYINHCKIGIYMAMLMKAWMISFVFKEFPSFFKRLIPSGIFLSNYNFKFRWAWFSSYDRIIELV
jgi:hypothetical protein